MNYRIEKIIRLLLWVLSALMLVYPAGAMICAIIGYSFEFTSLPVFAAVIGLIANGIVVLGIVFKSTPRNTATQIILAVLAPLSFIDAVLYIFNSPRLWIIVSMLTTAACCCYLVIRHVWPKRLRISALILLRILTLPLLFFSFLAFVFGNIGENTVVQTVTSPSGKYYAQLTDNDQGALGGATIVKVHEVSGIDTFLFKAEKKPREVYYGHWGEFMDMQIYWKDDECLVINSVEYTLN